MNELEVISLILTQAQQTTNADCLKMFGGDVLMESSFFFEIIFSIMNFIINFFLLIMENTLWNCTGNSLCQNMNKPACT